MVFLDILIMAMVAGFLIYRLSGVLGQRHGKERRRQNPFTPKPQEEAEVIEYSTSGLVDSLMAIEAADPSFNQEKFIYGARQAFKMIVYGFNQGDTDTLENLLSEKVYRQFTQVIKERKAAREYHETTIHEIVSAEIYDAEIKNNATASITVRFVSTQTKLIRDNQDRLLEGKPELREEVIDIWTFSRTIKSSDPSWYLTSTREEDESPEA